MKSKLYAALRDPATAFLPPQKLIAALVGREHPRSPAPSGTGGSGSTVAFAHEAAPGTYGPLTCVAFVSLYPKAMLALRSRLPIYPSGTYELLEECLAARSDEVLPEEERKTATRMANYFYGMVNAEASPLRAAASFHREVSALGRAVVGTILSDPRAIYADTDEVFLLDRLDRSEVDRLNVHGFEYELAHYDEGTFYRKKCFDLYRSGELVRSRGSSLRG